MTRPWRSTRFSAASAALLYLDRVELDTAVGRLDRAHQYLERAWQAAHGDETSTVTIQLHLMASVLAIEEQDLSTARRHIELLEEQMPGTGMPVRAVAQLCCIALRIDAEIDQRARWVHDLPPVLGDDERRELLARVHRVQSTASNPEIDALAATATAEYNRRQPVADPELWQRATEAWEKASQPYEVAYCCYRWAEAELDARKSSRAATGPLRKSHEIASSLGAATLQQQVAGLARRSRITLTPPTSEKETAPVSGAARLGITPREQDVLRALMLGQSNREIAKRLYLSPRTVEVHVSNLLGKLGAPTVSRPKGPPHTWGCCSPKPDPPLHPPRSNRYVSAATTSVGWRTAFLCKRSARILPEEPAGADIPAARNDQASVGMIERRGRRRFPLAVVIRG